MKTRIKSDQLVRYLAMGWKIINLAFNDAECWLDMEGSLRQKVLDDLGFIEDDVVSKYKIPGTKVTYRMMCCWYATERYGMTQQDVAVAFGIDPTTVRYALEKVERHIKAEKRSGR